MSKTIEIGTFSFDKEEARRNGKEKSVKTWEHAGFKKSVIERVTAEIWPEKEEKEPEPAAKVAKGR